MKIFNVVIVGTGFGALVHLPAFNIHPMYRVIGIYGRNYEKASQIAEKYNIKVYATKEEIANDKEVDLVSISSIVKEHFEDVKLFCNAKKYILLEKPMALSYEEASQMYDITKKKNICSAVCHEHKYDSSWQYIKKLIEEKIYGQLRSVYFDYRFMYWNCVNSQRKYDWFSQKELGGGLIGGHLSHVIDLLQFVDTSGIKSIQGEGVIEVPYHMDQDGIIKLQTAEDTVYATATMNSGVKAYVNLSAARYETKKTVCFYTEMAKIIIDGPSHVKIYDTSGALILDKIPFEFCINDYGKDFRINSFVRMLEDYYQCYINEKTSYISDFRAGMITQKILDKVKQGSGNGV